MDGDMLANGEDDRSDREDEGYVLPSPIPPEPGESLPSLVLRNAGLYHFRDPRRLLRQIWQATSSLAALAFVDPTSKFGGRLARLFGIARDQLACMTYGTEDPKRCTLLGHPVHHDFVSLDERRYCPLCLRQSLHHRAIWDLSLLTVCPEHGVRLLTHCPAGHRVNWRTDHVHLCARYECRRDLREASVEKVPVAELAGARGLVTLFQGRRPADLASHLQCPALQRPGDALRAAFHLGAIASGHHYSPRPIPFARKHSKETVRVLNAGWAALQDWPHGFHRLLDRLRADQEARRGRYGVNKEFGYLPQWLWESAEEPYGAVLGDAFHRYVAEKPDLATRAHEVRRFRSANDLRHRHMTGTEAVAVLGVTYDRLATLAAQHDLYLVPPTGKGAASLMRADRVHALLQQRSGLLTAADVQRRLGVGKITVRKLREAGLLATVSDPDAPGSIRHPVASVEGLLQDLAGRVPPDRPVPKDSVSIATIARRVPIPGYDTTDVIEAIRAGRLAPIGLARKGHGLQRFRFRSSDVDRFVAALTRVEGRTLSVVEAAGELGVKQEVAYHWVRTGLLATVTVDSPTESGHRVTAAALAAFRQEYMTGAEFARMHGLGRKWAATHLVQAGVQAVSGPSVDGARQFLFRRADLERFDASKLVSGRSKLRPEEARARRLAPAMCGIPDNATALSEDGGSERSNHAIGRALKRKFGEGLVRRYHSYRDVEAGTVIQVMTARNRGTTGTYEFLISTKHRQELAGAGRSFLALGFVDRADFLLVPWRDVEPLFESMSSHETTHGRVWRLWIRAGGDGQLAPFGEHAWSLRNQ
jgi:hypothetical protein